jgi:hypothetical protein
MRLDTPLDWDSANFACSNLGGYLVSYESAEENAFVAPLLATGNYWIGLDDEQVDGTFHWQDDVQIGAGSMYTNWTPTQPDGGINENCVYEIAGGATWEDGICTTALPYICERNPWVTDPATHHVYFHASGNVLDEDYAGAVTECTNRGGYLVSITTMEEQVVVDAITNATSFWIGLNDIVTEGAYVWESGETFGFSAWNTAAGEPTPVCGTTGSATRCAATSASSSRSSLSRRCAGGGLRSRCGWCRPRASSAAASDHRRSMTRRRARRRRTRRRPWWDRRRRIRRWWSGSVSTTRRHRCIRSTVTAPGFWSATSTKVCYARATPVASRGRASPRPSRSTKRDGGGTSRCAMSGSTTVSD